MLNYLARAYFKAAKLEESMRTLLKARHVAPQDTVVLYNLALVLQRLATAVLRDGKSGLASVLRSTQHLQVKLKFSSKYSNYANRVLYKLIDVSYLL